jgi:hypothetical protein
LANQGKPTGGQNWKPPTPVGQPMAAAWNQAPPMNPSPMGGMPANQNWMNANPFMGAGPAQPNQMVRIKIINFSIN